MRLRIHPPRPSSLAVFEDHDLPEVGFEWPDALDGLSQSERERDVESLDDICVLEQSRFFIRGILPIFVSGYEFPWTLNLWVEVRPHDCIGYLLRSSAPPGTAEFRRLPGRIANEVVPFLDALGSEVEVVPDEPGRQCSIWCSPRMAFHHSIGRAQANGITYEEAARAVALIRATMEFASPTRRPH